jgi:predicted phage baseplate assembly protein
MTLPLPNLDDRRWADLVDEAQALIPFFARGWTDHNAHDPGITIVDLLAWITESDIYRLNQITPWHRRKFLRLAGDRPQPPRAACTIAQFALLECVEPAELPRWTEVVATDVYGVRTPFRTVYPLTVVPSSIAVVQVYERRRYRDLTAAWQRGEPIALLGSDPDIGTELYLGLSQPLPPHVWATIALAFASCREDNPADGRMACCDDARRRLHDLAIARHALCRPPSLWQCAPPEDPPSPPPDVWHHHSACTEWAVALGGNRWRQLVAPGEVIDDTRAFTFDGRVQVCLPMAGAQVAVGEVQTPYHYLRCRLVGGQLDAAPKATAIALNATWCEQKAPPTVPRTPDGKTGVLVARGTGLPDQRLVLVEPPIVEESVIVTVRNDGTHDAVDWAPRDDFDASNPTAAHFVLDPTLGAITFGDGERGRIVPEDAWITVQYLTTRGDAGNLARDTALEVMGDAGCKIASAHTVLPATGGANTEDMLHAEGRVMRTLATSERAVTADDYERITLATPGTCIARAIPLPNRHPRLPCVESPGMITVVVVPYLPDARPVPTCALRAQVRAHLDRWRLVGTRVEVIGPEYVEVSVRATVEGDQGIDRADLQKRIVERLDGFFHPLRGGQDSKGWTLGRDVVRPEVLQVIDDVSGVDHVVALTLVQGEDTATCGNVCLGPMALVGVRPHTIEVV